jgi:hypothetical protein
VHLLLTTFLVVHSVAFFDELPDATEGFILLDDKVEEYNRLVKRSRYADFDANLWWHGAAVSKKRLGESDASWWW